MKLVINAGSSSLKAALFEKETCTQRYHYDLLAHKLSITQKNKKYVSNTDTTDIAHAMRDLTIQLKESNEKLALTHVLHRVVHGGEFFSEATPITAKVLEKIRALCVMAPLHNPPALACINKARELFPKVKHIAVFDTAYHQTLPEYAFRYALPKEAYTKLKIRKYGFHGTSHKYLAKEAKRIAKVNKVITCHLGNGSSLCANKNGKSIDTSMGLTPTEGIIMGTRSGHVGPEVPLFLLKYLKDAHKVDSYLNNHSGLLGISELSADVRVLWKQKKNPKAKLALAMLSYQLQNMIAQYHTILGGTQCIVFSGGIGENAWYVRRDALKGLAHLGIKIDEKKNKLACYKNKPMMIHKASSKVKILVIPTNEELQMIREV